MSIVLKVKFLTARLKICTFLQIQSVAEGKILNCKVLTEREGGSQQDIKTEVK